MTVQGPVKKQQPDGMSHGGYKACFLRCASSSFGGDHKGTLGGGGVPAKPPPPSPPSRQTTLFADAAPHASRLQVGLAGHVFRNMSRVQNG